MSTRIADPNVEEHIVIDNRTWIIPATLQTIAVQNDKNSETVYIDIPRSFDGIDRNGYSVYLRTVSDESGMDEILFGSEELEVTDDLIIAKWVLKPPQTSYFGSVTTYIIIRNGEYQWSTHDGRFTVKELTDADPIIPVTPDVYETWLENVSEQTNQAKQYAANASASASEAQAASNAASGSATNAQNSENAAKTSEENAAKSLSSVQATQKSVEDTAEIVQTIGDAVKAGKSPIIGDNGNWYIWDVDQYADSGVAATGPAGSQGADGKSAYEYAQDGGYTGTEQEFANKLAKDILPTVTTADAGKFLRVSESGEWVAENVPNAEEASF